MSGGIFAIRGFEFQATVSDRAEVRFRAIKRPERSSCRSPTRTARRLAHPSEPPDRTLHGQTSTTGLQRLLPCLPTPHATALILKADVPTIYSARRRIGGTCRQKTRTL